MLVMIADVRFMLTIARAIDALNDRVGRIVAWYLFSAIFLLAAGYTLRHGAHVRIDILYGRYSKRGRVPARHLRAAVAAREIDDVVLLEHLAHELEAAAVVHPGVLSASVQAERSAGFLPK